MRTTVNLDDDVLRTAKTYAEDRSLTLGAAISELTRRGLAVPRPTRVVNGLRVFDLPADSPQVISKRVRELEMEEK
jgi:hypothetical protein